MANRTKSLEQALRDIGPVANEDMIFFLVVQSFSCGTARNEVGRLFLFSFGVPFATGHRFFEGLCYSTKLEQKTLRLEQDCITVSKVRTISGPISVRRSGDRVNV